MIPKHILDNAVFLASVPALPDHKVVVTGYRRGVIYHLSKAHAEAIAKRINDEDHELHGHEIYNCKHLQTKAIVCPMLTVRPRIVAAGEGFDIIDNELFIKKYLDEVVGENCEFPETK
jgi:hypothetical protein